MHFTRNGLESPSVKQTILWGLFVVGFAAPVLAGPAQKDEPQEIAEKYLKALSDAKKQQGKDYLLGGVSLDAKSALVFSPKILSRADPRKEEGSVADLSSAVTALDKAGLELLEGGAALGGLTDPKAGVDAAKAKQMAEKTKQLRKELMTKYPVFSDIIRADRMIYWHPKNPARLQLQKAQKTGTYKAEYIAFTVESKDTAKEQPRQWPLRLVRIQTDGQDTGWKVLPASDWDPE